MLQHFHELLKDCRIAVIDDDASIHRLVAAYLSRDPGDLVSCFDGQTGLRTLLEQPVDLVLLDEDMPSLTGLGMLEKLRRDPRGRELPVVFATGSADTSFISACLAAGATDYLRKPLQKPELIARLGAALERQLLENRLKSAANTDPLTGLLNRTALSNELDRALARVRGNALRGLAVLFLDLDRFKTINDSMGHGTGDRMLRETSARLQGAITDAAFEDVPVEASSIARFGGDEFVLLIEGMEEEADLLALADRVLSRISQAYRIAGTTLHTTASVGMRLERRGNVDAEAVIKDADTAMYESKARGRGCVTFFNDAMRQRVERRLTLENDLRSAIDREELHVVYQPIVDLEHQRVVSYEALVRWCHRERGMVNPADFISLAEETGMIHRIGAWVLETACRDFADWQASMGDAAPDGLSVNLSRMQLGDAGLRDSVAGVLERTRMRPEAMQLEVTESLAMDDPRANQTLKELCGLGIHLAMDDFGTGHSSLACLHELPFDVLKIDRAFIAGLSRNRAFAAILRAIVDLADNLQIRLIAEGVETPEQIAMLQAIGCPFVQGFFFSRPISAADVPSFELTKSLGEPPVKAA